MFGYLLFLLIVNFICASAKYQDNCPIDCHHEYKDQSKLVSEFCDNNNGTMKGRCCIENGTKDYVTGLDLHDYGLPKINVSNVWCPGIKIIDLVENDLHNVSKEDFIGFTNLIYLYLPPGVACPGGLDAWGGENETRVYNECYLELDLCAYLNVSCTTNGECTHKGPGFAQCECLPGHYGYKCLQEGEFPVLKFALGLVLPTIVLSASSWLYLRRNVISVIKEAD